MAAPLCNLSILLNSSSNDAQAAVRQGPLKLQCLIGRLRHPGLDFLCGAQNYGHRLGMNYTDLGVGFRGQKAEHVVGRLAFLYGPNRSPIGPDTGETSNGRVSSKANQMSPPSALLNSLNDVNGPTQR